MFNPQLKVLITVADCGSFNRAAETLYLTPTALIKQINGLEDHLKLKLLVRSPRGVKLTPAGEIIYRHAKEIFTISKLAVSEAAAVTARNTYAVRVGTSLLYPGHSFMSLWFSLSDQFENCSLNLVPFDDAHHGLMSVLESLGEKYDFLVVPCEEELWSDRCSYLQIGTAMQNLLVPKDHPLAARGRINVEDLRGEKVMIFRRGATRVIDEIHAELSEYPDIRVEEVSQYFDITVFNRCVETNTPMIALECWDQIHPALVPINQLGPCPARRASLRQKAA